MNIKDLPQGSYKVVQPTSATLNVKNLPQGSYKPVSTDTFPTREPESVKQSFMQKLTDFSGKNEQGIVPDFRFTPKDMGNSTSLSGTVGNQVKSVANLGIGVAKFLDPIANAKKIGQAAGSAINYGKDIGAQSQSEQAGKDYIPKLQAAIDKNKAIGKDTTQLERLLKDAGGAPSPATFQSGIDTYKKELPNAIYRNVAPAALTKGVEASKNGGGFSEGFHAAVQSIAEDPQQLAPYFLMSKSFIEKSLPKVDSAISDVGGLPKKAVSTAYNAVKDPIKNALQVKAQTDLYNTYNEVFTGTKSAKKTFDKSTATGKDPAAFGADNGYIVEVQKGKYNAQPTIEKVKTEYVEPRAKVLDDLLAAKDKTMSPTEYVNLDLLAKEAKKGIESNPLAKGSGTLSQQQLAIDNIIGELKLQYGEKVPLSVLNEIKKAQWAESSSFDLTKPKFMGDVNYQIGKAAKDTIEVKVPEASIKQLNSEIGNAYDFSNNLRKIDGGAVKGGRLGQYFARTVGSIVGASHGPFGSITGALAGDYISGLMQNRAITTPMKRVALESIKPNSALFEEAQLALHRLENTPSYPDMGITTEQTIKPADLGNKKLPSTIKVNDYQKPYPSYKSPDQINSATKFLNAKQQAGKSLDMKVEKTNLKGSKELQPLAQEAQKYKSAEEFVKAQQPNTKPLSLNTKEVAIKDLNAHGAPELKDAIRNVGNGATSKTNGAIEITQRPTGELIVLDGQHRVIEAMNKGESKVKVKVIPYDEAINPEFGYTVANLVKDGDPVPFQTKSQLTDFYNKVKKKLPLK